MVDALGEKLPNVDSKEQCGHLTGTKQNNVRTFSSAQALFLKRIRMTSAVVINAVVRRAIDPL